MTKRERAKLIRRYAEGGDEVVRALEVFPPEKLTARPFRGKWTAAEIVHHLADSEMTAAIRLRLLVVQERPVIQGYDQDEFAIRLRYNEREIGAALAAFLAARATTVEVLERMTAEQWARQGWHTEAGLYGPERWLTIYAEHAHKHAGQITHLREALAAKASGRKRPLP